MPRDRVPFSYRALQAWARSAIYVVYRHTDVTGLENLPGDRPAILAANHSNALADIAVIVAKTHKFPQFLAAASWWKSAPARLLFRLGGVVPIHRARDGNDTGQNVSTFEACHAALAEGAHIAIFPEGEMHTGSTLMPLKTGAARIALGAASDAGVRGIVIVPVGLVYEDRGRFRSDAEIHFGEPIEIDQWTEQAREDPRQAARDITDILGERLADIAVNHGSCVEADVVDQAAQFVSVDGPRAATRSYARRNQIRRSLMSSTRVDAATSATQYRDLAAAVAAHAIDLADLGVEASHDVPALSEPSDEERSRVARELTLLAPPAALGLVAGAPIAVGASLACSRAKQESWRDTTRGVAGTLLCPVVWTLECAFLARRIRGERAVLLTAAGVTGGIAALMWGDRFERRREIAWLDRARAERPVQLAAARASRELLRERIVALTGGI